MTTEQQLAQRTAAVSREYALRRWRQGFYEGVVVGAFVGLGLAFVFLWLGVGA